MKGDKFKLQRKFKGEKENSLFLFFFFFYLSLIWMEWPVYIDKLSLVNGRSLGSF